MDKFDELPTFLECAGCADIRSNWRTISTEPFMTVVGRTANPWDWYKATICFPAVTVLMR